MAGFSHTLENKHGQRLGVLVLGALGVVYGDIGTSPLYAMRECFVGLGSIPASPANVLGVLSLITWALIIVISLKYILFVLRADNEGEGGILALMELTLAKPAPAGGWRRFLVVTMGLFGAALLYGDGMITPSISVLSAVEGLEVATPVFSRYVVPITVVILVILFAFQSRGSSQIGAVFGPVILVWLTTIGVLGVISTVHTPAVLAALNPWHALRFFFSNGAAGFVVLGAVFLVVTGGEALYADMGHFGRRAIQWGWYGAVLPALLLNYYGQGALIIRSPETITNPFYALAPEWGVIPLVLVATAATIVASQALISGTFSLTRQAILLGYLPRIPIVHTSSSTIGQIFVPDANRFLMLATISLVFAFRSSGGLAAAYGVGVTSLMLITTILFIIVARQKWGWHLHTILPVAGLFLLFDVSFFLSALLKVPRGGWVPLAVALVVFLVMTTWHKGRQILYERLYERLLPLEEFINKVVPNESHLARTAGTAAVFLTGNPSTTPPVLLHNIKYNKVLHETTILLNIAIETTPYLKESERVSVEDLGKGFYRIIARYGFMESPNVPEALALCKSHGLDIDIRTVGFFIGREEIVTTRNPQMSPIRQQIFSFLTRNAQKATSFYGVPPNQVVELGVRVLL